MKLIFLIIIAFCANVNAQVQRHDFSITGDNGETGTGFFTWDDTVTANGINLTIANMIDGSLTITGGTTPGGSQTFLLAEWGAGSSHNHFEVTPDFVNRLIFVADNGTETLTSDLAGLADTFSVRASWGSAITYIPGVTPAVQPTPVPTLSFWAILILSSLIIMAGINAQNRREF